MSDRDVDIFFGSNLDLNIPYFLNDHEDVFMQDLGFHESLDDTDEVPVDGFTIFATEIVEGHMYAFLTREGHDAKMLVTESSIFSVTFDWAFQTQRDNPNVAPALNLSALAGGIRPTP